MKHKLTLFTLLPILFLFFSMPVHAQAPMQSNRELVETGYTAEGIYYEVYDITTVDNSLNPNSTSQYVSKEIIYYGTITPADSIAHSETINGVIYSGTLKLYKYQWKSGKTHAFYQGYIYPST